MVTTEAQNPTSQLQNTNFLSPETHATQVNDGPDLSSNSERPADNYSSSLSSRDNLVAGRKRPQVVKAVKEDKHVKLDT